MEWLNGLRKMPFDIPIVWREPKDHSSYYYSCLKSVRGITYKSIHTAKYPDLSSADSDKNHGQPEGVILIVFRHLKQVLPHLDPVY